MRMRFAVSSWQLRCLGARWCSNDGGREGKKGADLQAHVQAGVQRRREALPAAAARQLGKVYPLRSPRAVSQADGCWQAGAHRQAGAEKRSGCAQRDAPSGSKAEFHGPGVRVARLKQPDCCGRSCGRKPAPPRADRAGRPDFYYIMVLKEYNFILSFNDYMREPIGPCK